MSRVLVTADDQPHTDEALALRRGANGGILASEPITAGILGYGSALKVLARSGLVYASIGVAAAFAREIRRCNTRGVNHNAVTEVTIALMYIGARTLSPVTGEARAGRWPHDGGRQLRVATPGILGDGTYLESRAGIRARCNGSVGREPDLFQLIFFPTLLALISAFTTLYSGDVILTGTPAGTGRSETPKDFLIDRDQVAVKEDGVGAALNSVVPEPLSPRQLPESVATWRR